MTDAPKDVVAQARALVRDLRGHLAIGMSLTVADYNLKREDQRVAAADTIEALLDEIERLLTKPVSVEGDRIQLNPPNMRKKFGVLDEVLFQQCTAHLEQLDRDHWYLGLYRGDDIIQVWLAKDGKSVKATFESDAPCPMHGEA